MKKKEKYIPKKTTKKGSILPPLSNLPTSHQRWFWRGNRLHTTCTRQPVTTTYTGAGAQTNA
jgi:hypothetical protein